MPDNADAKRPSTLAVLFCCMGNICRSPTVEAVFRRQVVAAGLEQRVRIDSAGTHAYHAGCAPDARTQRVAAARGYDLGHLRARQITRQDFAGFDYILAMDRQNLAELKRLSAPEYHERLALFMDFGTGKPGADVPDPYYGGPEGFAQVLSMAEDGCAGLVAAIKKKLG